MAADLLCHVICWQHRVLRNECCASFSELPGGWTCHETALETLETLAQKKDMECSREPKALGWRNWANLVAYVVNLATTYASLTGVFGRTNTELSAKYQTLVTPAGYAFSIWGPIFIWEGVFAVTQMLQSFREKNVITSMTPFWLSACAFQCAWTLAFAQDQISWKNTSFKAESKGALRFCLLCLKQLCLKLMKSDPTTLLLEEQITLAFLAMLGILMSLLLGIVRTDAKPIATVDFWLLRAPFSLHAGGQSTRNSI